MNYLNNPFVMRSVPDIAINRNKSYGGAPRRGGEYYLPTSIMACHHGTHIFHSSKMFHCIETENHLLARPARYVWLGCKAIKLV